MKSRRTPRISDPGAKRPDALREVQLPQVPRQKPARERVRLHAEHEAPPRGAVDRAGDAGGVELDGRAQKLARGLDGI